VIGGDEMEQLSVLSRVGLYVLMGLIGFFAVIVGFWQVQVIRGKAMKNPDGSADDWHEQKVVYGMAFADLLIAVPVCLAGIVLTFVDLAGGTFVLSLGAFWFVWANVMTTVNSLRFEKPKITPIWFVTFPAGIFVGLAYFAWVIAHFNAVFQAAASGAG